MMTCEPLACSLVEDEQREEFTVTVLLLLLLLLFFMTLKRVTFTQMIMQLSDLLIHQQRMLPAGMRHTYLHTRF
jgi:hypothetical protein